MPATTYVVSGFSRTVVFTSLRCALSGFAAMGMEILWLRHFNLLLGRVPGGLLARCSP